MLLTHDPAGTGCTPVDFDRGASAPPAAAGRPRFRRTLIETPPALLLGFEGKNCSSVFFAAIQKALLFDPRLTFAGGRLGRTPAPHLFLRFTHPAGPAPLAEFGEAFAAFFAAMPQLPEPLPSAAAFELSASVPQEPGDVARFCRHIEASPFLLSEFACGSGFRFDFGRGGDPFGVTAEERLDFHFRLGSTEAAPEAAFPALLAQADPRWQMGGRRFGDRSSA
jgi:hypothetical protein